MIFFVPVEIGERNRCCNYVNSNLIDDGSVPCFIPDGMLVFDDDACYRYCVPHGTMFRQPASLKYDHKGCTPDSHREITTWCVKNASCASWFFVGFVTLFFRSLMVRRRNVFYRQWRNGWGKDNQPAMKLLRRSLNDHEAMYEHIACVAPLHNGSL